MWNQSKGDKTFFCFQPIVWLAKTEENTRLDQSHSTVSYVVKDWKRGDAAAHTLSVIFHFNSGWGNPNVLFTCKNSPLRNGREWLRSHAGGKSLNDGPSWPNGKGVPGWSHFPLWPVWMRGRAHVFHLIYPVSVVVAGYWPSINNSGWDRGAETTLAFQTRYNY